MSQSDNTPPRQNLPYFHCIHYWTIQTPRNISGDDNYVINN